MKRIIGDMVATAFDGFAWAVILAWLLMIATRIGVAALGLGALPIICAYHLGSERGFRRWKRFQAQLEGKEPPT